MGQRGAARAQRQGTASRAALLAYLGLAAAVVLADLLVTTSSRLPVDLQRLLSDLAQTGTALGVGALVLVRSRSGAPSTRRTWCRAGAAALAWGAGQALVTVQGVTGTGSRPGAPDGPFAVAVVLAVLAALAFPTVAPRAGRGRALLDGALVACSALFLAWTVPLHGQLAGGSDHAGAVLLALAYPLVDVAVVTMLLSGGTRVPREHAAALVTAVAGIAVLTVTSLESFALARDGVLGPGAPVEVGYLAGFVLLGLGALLQQVAEPVRAPEPGRRQQLLPYALLPAVALVLLGKGTGVGDGPLALAVLVCGLLVARQAAAVVENSDLSAQLLARGRRYEALVQGSTEHTLVLDAAGRLTHASPAFGRLLGVPPEELLGRRLARLVLPDAAWDLQDALARLGPGGSEPVALRLQAGDREVHLEGHVSDLTALPEVAGVVLNAHDVTDRWRDAQALAVSERRYREIVETAQEGLLVLDEGGTVRLVNPRLGEVVGLPQEALVGRPLGALLAGLQPAPGTREVLEGVLARLRSGRSASFEVALRRPDGRPLHLRVATSPLGEGADGSVLALVTDTTEQVLLREQLRRQTVTDVLTGLGNRVLLADEGARVLAGDGGAALLYVDLDTFKAVNDSWGHPAGDALLQEVAARLRGCPGVADGCLVRLGGDEFAVLLPGGTEQQALAVAAGLHEALQVPVPVQGRPLQVSASVGVAVARPGEGLDTLMRNADLAMYRAKAEGHGRTCAYAASMHAEVSSRLALQQDLRTAVADGMAAGQVEVHYQPFVDLATGACVGAEALLRWRHPELGLVPPDVFVPLAEESGLVGALGVHVLEQACAQVGAWEQVTGRPMMVSVNVSPRQLLDGDLVPAVERSLAAGGLAPGSLLLEITERSLVAGPGPTRVLEQLGERGVRLALDDFGTGWSSLAHLRDHRIDVLKLDRSYVSAIAVDPEAHRLVRAILGLAGQLGLGVTAEGVEQDVHAAMLAAAGCERAQGWLWAPAMPAQEFRTWLAGRVDAPARAVPALLPAPRRPPDRPVVEPRP